jgi:hypothetical protein
MIEDGFRGPKTGERRPKSTSTHPDPADFNNMASRSRGVEMLRAPSASFHAAPGPRVTILARDEIVMKLDTVGKSRCVRRIARSFFVVTL